jgi:Mce-associated membrane protein
MSKGIIAVRSTTKSNPERDEAKAVRPTAGLDTSETPESRESVEIDASDVSEDGSDSETTFSDEAATGDADGAEQPTPRPRPRWSRVAAFGVIPALAVLAASAAGFLKWHDGWLSGSEVAAAESVSAAKESTVALLSYQPDSVEKDLAAARNRLTGKFKDSYTQLVHDVVIPGAKKDHVAAIATVAAAASVSATPDHAVTLLFVNQAVTLGNDAPTSTASTVRVTLDKSDGHWLIAEFEPV